MGTIRQKAGAPRLFSRCILPAVNALAGSCYAKKYRDPLPVLTTSPELTVPCVMGLVVTFCPSLKLGEPRMFPVMVPSPFLRQPLMVGTPRGAVRAGCFGAGARAAAGGALVVVASAAALSPPPPPNKENVARGLGAAVAGFVAGAAFATCWVPLNNDSVGRVSTLGGVVDFWGDTLCVPPPKSENDGRALSAVAGAVEAAEGPPPPNKEMLCRGTALRAASRAVAASRSFCAFVNVMVAPGKADMRSDMALDDAPLGFTSLKK